MNPPASNSAQREAESPPAATTTHVALASSDAERSPPGTTIDRLAAGLAREMRRRWRAGERPGAEEWLARHPELSQHPEAAVDVIYEEYCLRHGAAAPSDTIERDLLRRFPQFDSQLRVMFECHRRLLESERDRPAFPEQGDVLGDFRLTTELARGVRGRVFLATQTELADRPVVLKITPLDGAEHISLARLQHSNIVPLYSAFDDAARRLRVLCMPFFGRATLAAVLNSFHSVPHEERTGHHIVAAIERLQDPSCPLPPAADAPTQMLARRPYPHAICWIAASLADALHFAHARGVVHLDLKPSNVLLATDGQPMLLDFHLARAPIPAQGQLPERLGGTLSYMPPEQRNAIQRLHDGAPAQVAIDGRADIYSLGVILYESLGGRVPVESDAPSLATLNRQVTPGLADIVARCLAPRPEDRYPDAASLADDLRRHLADRPLAGVPNRSTAERWSKWRRRHPSALRAALALSVLAGALAILFIVLASAFRDRRNLAELSLRDGQRQLQHGNPTDAVPTLERGLALVETLPWSRGLRRQLHDELRAARRLELAHQLRRLADELRVLYGADAIPAAQLRPIADRARDFWHRRASIISALAPPADDDAGLNEDLHDVAICVADLHFRLARDPSQSDPRKALRILDEAESLFGPSAVLAYERTRLSSVTTHLTAPATPTSRRTAPPPPSTAWAHYALGRAMLAANDLPAASAQFSEALRLDPAGRWPNFYAGVCAHRAAQHQDAVTAFSVCIGADPAVAGYFYNRALAHAALGRADLALRDYDHALRIDPAHAPSALNRGVLHFNQGHHDQALADLTLALQHGADPAAAHYDLALVHDALRDPARALHHARLALRHDPAHESARRLHDALERNTPASPASD